MCPLIPANMYAIQVASDEALSLHWEQAHTPQLVPEEVIVRARATAVNRADLLQRMGKYPVPPGASPILGLEVAGEVAGVGPRVSGWKIGDRVCALLAGGGYAEYVSCRADALLPIPARLSFVEAAALPEAVYTAYLNLYMEAGLQAGERALIHAGASGVGSIAIQLCRQLGSPVYATASQRKLPLLRELGVDAAIDREAEDFADEIRVLTQGKGVDVILDPVGGAYLARNIESLARGGRLVVIGLLGGASAELPLGRLLMQNQRILGSTLRSRSTAEKAQMTRQIEQHVWPLVAEGRIVPVIDREFPIQQVEQAHTLMRSNETAGKLVLTLNQASSA